MTAVDKAAIAWTIAIVAVGVGFAAMGDQFQPSAPSAPVQTTPPAVEKVPPAATTQPTITKPTMPGWERVESIQDPGIGHETHQLAVIIPPGDKMLQGTLQYDASEPIQLVSLIGPLAPGEDVGQPIWTPDGKTKFALTLVDQKKAKGTWDFEGNALAVHTFRTTTFVVDYKLVGVKEVQAMPEEKPVMEKPAMKEPSGPKTVKVSIPSGSSSPGCEETNECYLPPSVSINAGDTVAWSNNDSAAHTVTSGTPTDGPDGKFDSSLLIAGGVFEYTFDSAGSYNYFCMVHPWMTGNVKVS